MRREKAERRDPESGGGRGREEGGTLEEARLKVTARNVEDTKDS